ncbi:alanine racemase [Balneola sp. MJW-20]|uniref:alanine racemase n=1 Tax=Gracilimonas aurantiaca TaxID=3234185 RepID=UPI003464FD19
MISTIYIDLRKIEANLRAVERRLRPGIQKMAVVKDNAYGHGMIPVSKFLADKVEWFCVARVEEGVELRKAGISNPVLVLELPQLETADLYPAYDLTASISDLGVFDILRAGTKAHIHFDTGMFRLGILPEDAAEVENKVTSGQIDINGIYTHFANSDVSSHNRVKEQLEIFQQIRSRFPEEWMTHTANSGAIFYYNDLDLHYDAVRPGVCLYGYAPGPDEINDLEPVIEWQSKLVQVKKIRKGGMVGYGSRWAADSDGWIGVIPVGYAQGIFRSLTNKIPVRIAGKLYPTVGTISMDYIMVWLGQDKVDNGTVVTLMDKDELSAKEWAAQLGTIPYEITTAISDKIKRVFNY